MVLLYRKGTTSNPHIAEERVMNLVGENGTNEEERFVLRFAQ